MGGGSLGLLDGMSRKPATPLKNDVAGWIRIVTTANRVVFISVLVVVASITLLAAPGLYNPEWERGWFYPVFVIGIPLTWVAGLITGASAVLLHLLGRWDGFWHSAAPPVLGFVCLNFMMASIPPPPLPGAVAAVAIGVLCLSAVWRPDTWRHRWGIVPLLVLPFLDRLPPLAFWAPLTAGILFFGIGASARMGRKWFLPRA
jgi:hypothetical protein